ncbi:MAG TPA: LysR family transcriptional regulator [Nitrospiraceae bacterium]|nr:LysR family transcriptional regulator [Nitrospiraceae bacterium]
MDIHHLKVFISVFKNRSFSKASEQLSLTQSTISSHIKAVEEELGCKLFDRLGRTIIPTKEAELLYPRASEIIENLEEIKSGICQIKDDMGGELIIGASTIPGAYVIPSIVSEFKRKYKETSFQVLIEDSKKITDMVACNELLLGIVGAKMENRKIEYCPFVEDELIFISSPEVLDRKTISMEDITGVPFLLREEGSGTRKTVERHLSEKGISVKDLNVVAVLGSTDAMKEAIKSGLGASILSRVAVRDELKTGILKEVKVKGLDMTRSFYIITHRRRTLPKNYRLFTEYLKGKS